MFLLLLIFWAAGCDQQQSGLTNGIPDFPYAKNLKITSGALQASQLKEAVAVQERLQSLSIRYKAIQKGLNKTDKLSNDDLHFLTIKDPVVRYTTEKRPVLYFANRSELENTLTALELLSSVGAHVYRVPATLKGWVDGKEELTSEVSLLNEKGQIIVSDSLFTINEGKVLFQNLKTGQHGEVSAATSTHLPLSKTTLSYGSSIIFNLNGSTATLRACSGERVDGIIFKRRYVNGHTGLYSGDRRYDVSADYQCEFSRSSDLSFSALQATHKAELEFRSKEVNLLGQVIGGCIDYTRLASSQSDYDHDIKVTGGGCNQALTSVTGSFEMPSTNLYRYTVGYYGQ